MKPPTDKRCQLCHREGHAWYTLDSGRVAWLCKGPGLGCGVDHWLRRACDERMARAEKAT